MLGAPDRGRLYLAASVLLCALSLVALGVPGVDFVRTSSNGGITLSDGPHELDLPADETYGIYVDDADNSGYTQNCSAADADGRDVPLRSPSWNITSSDTEMLDFEFETGSGLVVVDCSVPGERVVVRELPSERALLLGILVGGVLGCLGVWLGIAWLVVRASRRAARVTASPHPVA